VAGGVEAVEEVAADIGGRAVGQPGAGREAGCAHRCFGIEAARAVMVKHTPRRQRRCGLLGFSLWPLAKAVETRILRINGEQRRPRPNPALPLPSCSYRMETKT